MTLTVATYGNSALNIGHGIAADLSLAGYKVHLFDWPRYHETLMPLQKKGGINVTGNPEALTSRKTGFAKIDLITTDPKAAFSDADVVFLDIYPAYDVEEEFTKIAPYLKQGAIINFNNYGYWPSLRVAPILKKLDRKDITISETSAPLYVLRGKDTELSFQLMRQGIPVSVFPANRSKETIKILRELYPSLTPAKNILETNFDNLNMQGHSAIALLNVAYFERAKEHGDATAYFYGTGITPSTGVLTEAQDAEREPVCKAYDVKYTMFRDTMQRYYGGEGETLDELELSTEFIRGIPAYDTNIWALWVKADISMAMVPFVQLAKLAGVQTPIHCGFIDIFRAIMEIDYWVTSYTLENLGLAGMSVEEIKNYITNG